MSVGSEVELSVSQFVELLNQTLDYAYPSVTIIGELANLRVSRGMWVYFDLKDEESSVKFFGSVQVLRGHVVENGMLLKVRGLPRLHNQFGFSVNIQSIQLVGEGTLKRAADLLHAKLAKEGLFDETRKRALPALPQRIGLITSKQSAAYADFIKILNQRWQGVDVDFVDVQVQGEAAPRQVVEAISRFNSLDEKPEILVLIRGGGSPEDLAAFSTEEVTRAVATSSIPTLVAIGHEIDLSLAELAADKMASTPSNAAELLVPDRQQELAFLDAGKKYLGQQWSAGLAHAKQVLDQQTDLLASSMDRVLGHAERDLKSHLNVLEAINPQAVLRRGYAVVRADGQTVRSYKQLRAGKTVDVELADGGFEATVRELTDGKDD